MGDNAGGLQVSRRPEVPQPHDNILHLGVTKFASIPQQPTPIFDYDFEFSNVGTIFLRRNVRFEVLTIYPEEFR